MRWLNDVLDRSAQDLKDRVVELGVWGCLGYMILIALMLPGFIAFAAAAGLWPESPR